MAPIVLALLLLWAPPALSVRHRLPLRTTGSSNFYKGYQQLVDGINLANQNAKACKGSSPTCLGTKVTVNLRNDVHLAARLPVIEPSANLEVIGKCVQQTRTSLPRPCVVDGAKKHRVFKSGPVQGGAPFQLTLKSLLFRNAKGGILPNMWGSLNISDCTFRNNTGGIEYSFGAKGGYPSRTYTNCVFQYNKGGIIMAGSTKDGLSSASVAYHVKHTLFDNNFGSWLILDGGAIHLQGKGNSIFENTTFWGNRAYRSGGGIYLDSTSVVFKGVRFHKNVAPKMFGGGIAGTSGPYGPLSLTLCSSEFKKNYAPEKIKSRNLYVVAPKTASKAATALFCNTADPKGSEFVNTKATMGSSKQCSVCN